jgi:hypothetical protein
MPLYCCWDGMLSSSSCHSWLNDTAGCTQAAAGDCYQAAVHSREGQPVHIVCRLDRAKPLNCLHARLSNLGVTTLLAGSNRHRVHVSRQSLLMYMIILQHTSHPAVPRCRHHQLLSFLACCQTKT